MISFRKRTSFARVVASSQTVSAIKCSRSTSVFNWRMFTAVRYFNLPQLIEAMLPENNAKLTLLKNSTGYWSVIRVLIQLIMVPFCFAFDLSTCKFAGQPQLVYYFSIVNRSMPRLILHFWLLQRRFKLNQLASTLKPTVHQYCLRDRDWKNFEREMGLKRFIVSIIKEVFKSRFTRSYQTQFITCTSFLFSGYVKK